MYKRHVLKLALYYNINNLDEWQICNIENGKIILMDLKVD
jgi:hypothetical protein